MHSRSALFLVFAALASAHVRAQLASAQPATADAGVGSAAAESPGEVGAGAADAGAQPALRAPELRQAAEAAYPEAARAAAVEGGVVLRLAIDAEGRVTAAEVAEPAGHGFDEAAREAALRFLFTPALRDGQPVAARILYRYEFRLPKPPEAAVPTVPAPAQATAPPAALPLIQEVEVRGKPSEAEALRQSAEAVTVIDARRARRESSELGEVLARVPGVSVRRAGGLGSDERLSMSGLTDHQIRTFIDGVPLELAFFPFGLSSLPISLVDRVEIYKGVVPIRFGADALGGAVNLVSDRRYETGFGGSYELGSFGTQRATLDGGYRHDPTDLVFNAQTFFDDADNDYEVDVEVPDERGRLSPARVFRFHDGYRAYGGTAEAGILDQPWARRLTLRGYAVSYDKELQHNLVMTVPYGEAEYGETAVGATARYQVLPRRDLELEVIASYSYRAAEFVDKSAWVYDWYGERIRERRILGEIDGETYDQIYWIHDLLGRAVVAYSIAPEHVLTLVSSPRFATATGEDRTIVDPTAPDPLSAERMRLTVVSGIEYESNFFAMADAPEAEAAREPGTDYHLQNLLFVKDYFYRAESEELQPGSVFRERERELHRLGFGNGVRYRFTRYLLAKLSYEYATRLPNPSELFGNGLLTLANLTLVPEVSHNANVGPQLDLSRTPAGDFKAEAFAFVRDADQLIVLLNNDRFSIYQNVFRARALGVEGALTWTSPGEYLTLDGSFTFQDFRNASDQGTFGDFEGDRIPNRPWLFGSWGARLHFEQVFSKDELEPFYVGRFVNEYFRGWESQGLRQYKQSIAAQSSHGVGITYVLDSGPGTFSATLEVQNLTDAKLFDYYGVQKPGRGVYLKVAGDFR